jgi:two-component system chemotaxis response regulator CheY
MAAPLPETDRMKFLVVDDSAVTRRIIVNALTRLGHKDVVEAADGHSALHQCDTSVDVVITDWNLPGMSGVELVRTLRANPDLSGLPVLLVTARNVKQDVVEAADAGVDAYIVKPFTLEVLQHKLAETLAARTRRAGSAEAASPAPSESGATDATPATSATAEPESATGTDG